MTTIKHLELYRSIFVVLLLLMFTAPISLLFGLVGAIAARSKIFVLNIIGKTYIALVRGVPDIAFFMFFVIALDQAFEWIRHKLFCPDWQDAIRQGNDFVVCAEAKLPLNAAAQWVHETYSFAIAILTFSIVFGAFTANVLLGAMRTVPKDQIETAEAYGMSQRQTFWRIIVPQMWIYALPGLSNLWMILIKATPLLFLLGIEDIVYWARELGSTKTSKFTAYPHEDWRVRYFLTLLIFYLGFTRISEIFLERLMRRLTFGQAIYGAERQRVGDI